MVLEFLPKVKRGSRTFTGAEGISISDPYVQIFALHSFSDSLKYASLGTVTLWPASKLLQRTVLRSISVARPTRFFGYMAFLHLLGLSSYTAYEESQGGFDYAKAAFEAQNNSRELELENWGWIGGLSVGLLSVLLPGVRIAPMAVTGFVLGFGFIDASDLLVDWDLVDRKDVECVKSYSPLAWIGQYSVSGGYHKGFDDEDFGMYD